MSCRFDSSQVNTMKGNMLLPSSVVTEPTWRSIIKPFLDLYIDDLPSRHTLDAELLLWSHHWKDKWDDHFRKLKEQHVVATGSELSLSPAELRKLKMGSVPCTIQSIIEQINPDLFPNTFCILTIIGVLPVTTCEIEQCVSSLRRLKTYLRSTMGQERLTGLALMHVHQHISVELML